ncbi:MAG: hypothetical protein EOQ64_18890 [Mesorhizobium sp.]|uniref:hypothetical protein n=1 Tax=Mesorhizobium sp. TaxID=1871066 RepID=UPI000FE4D566|nr:hypothetical protein [Mesorhizobium sp.]RWG54851.1 MAG: hypothetical protein EOQ64_18890 [Mesorhizobium sp.]
MKFLIVFVILATPAAAQEMSPTACNTLSASAENASVRLNDMLSSLSSGEAFRAAMPVMPKSAQAAAADAEDARVGAASALKEYMLALEDFSKAIKDCGN